MPSSVRTSTDMTTVMYRLCSQRFYSRVFLLVVLIVLVISLAVIDIRNLENRKSVILESAKSDYHEDFTLDRIKNLIADSEDTEEDLKVDFDGVMSRVQEQQAKWDAKVNKQSKHAKLK